MDISDIFYFFLLGEGEGESEALGGGRGVSFSLKMPGGGVSMKGRGRGAGEGVCSELGNWGGGGGGAQIFFFGAEMSSKYCQRPSTFSLSAIALKSGFVLDAQCRTSIFSSAVQEEHGS